MSNVGIFSWLCHGGNACFILDKKSLEKIFRLMDKVMKSCQQPRMNLRNSPPYILDIVPDIFAYLSGIIKHYEENFVRLNELQYFRLFVQNMNQKCGDTLQLFKSGKELMFIEGSVYRHQLTTHSLVYSHMLKDLEALFPNFTFGGNSFQVTKCAAAAWWSTTFGCQTIVPWKHFQTAMASTHYEGRLEGMEACALKKTVDLTRNNHVSIFEFDVFVRLFQPWENIIQNWNVLAVTHAAYKDFQTYDDVKARLQRCPPGSYIYRQSCTKLGQWAIGYVTENGQILQTIIQNKSLAQALMDGEREGFYLFPNGQPCGSQSSQLVSQLLQGLSEIRIPVTPEQYQVYCEMGSTFQMCKICAENDKDVRLEPCGHLLCSVCLSSWSSSADGQSCPFCRREIKGTEQVVVDPFRPPSLQFNDIDKSNVTINSLQFIPEDVWSLHRDEKAPPRPPRFGSPAASPGCKRRLMNGTIHSLQQIVPTLSETHSAPNTPKCVPRAHSTIVCTKNINYAQLDFEDSDSDIEDDLTISMQPLFTTLTATAPRLNKMAFHQQQYMNNRSISASSTSTSSGTPSIAESPTTTITTTISNNTFGIPQFSDTVIERLVAQLVREGQSEIASRRLLAITENNLHMTRAILREFQLINL